MFGAETIDRLCNRIDELEQENEKLKSKLRERMEEFEACRQERDMLQFTIDKLTGRED